MAKKHLATNAKSKVSLPAHPIYCHLCKVSLKRTEAFRLHIMQKHRPRSKLYEGDSDTSSDPEDELHIKSEVEIKLGEDENNDPEITDYTKKIFNISETAVSPQSSLSKKANGENDLPNILHNECDQLNGNKASEQVSQSSPTNNSSFKPSSLTKPESEVVLSNNPLQLVNSYITPLISSVYGRNQLLNQCQSTTNPMTTPEIAFTLDAKSIIQWYNKWKRISKPLKDPLPVRYLKKMKIVHKTIFDSLPIDGILDVEEKHVVLKIFEEMEDILCKSAEYVGKNL